MRLLLSLRKKTTFSFLTLLACGTFLMPVSLHAVTGEKPVKQVNISVPKPPQLIGISDQELDVLIDKANKGDEVAQNEVVKRFHWANFSEELLKKVNIGHWNKAEEKAKKDYQFSYVLISRNHIKNFPSVFKSIEERAELGDAAFQNLLGLLYSYSGSSDYKWEAFEWYRKSANQGFAPGQHNLASSYERGMGVAKNDTKAYELQKKAADQGYAVAQFRVGLMLFQGRGVKENMREAAVWMEKSAAQGYTEAQEFLQFLKASGWDKTQDVKSSLSLTQAAAEKGNIYAQRMLGDQYYNGQGVQKDDEKALIWWLKAADQNDKQSLSSIGSYYLFDRDSSEDQKKAFMYLQKATDLGDENSQACLGLMYYRGLGTEKNEKKGLELLLDASEKGSIVAEWFLGPILGQ